MHWLTKVTLFFPSLIIVLFACQEKKKEVEVVEEEKLKDAIDDLLSTIVEVKNLEHEEVERLIIKIDALDNGISGYTTNNQIDPGKLLFSAKNDSLFNDFQTNLNELGAKSSSYDAYTVWGKSEKLDFEVSISPHPTEDWILMIR